MTLARRLAVALVATLTVATFLVHAAVLRPHLYPAGAGLTLSGDAIMNELAEPPPVGFAHVPDVGAALGQPITITNVWPEGSAARAGLTVGMIVTGVEDASGRRVEWGGALPENADAVIRLWAEIYRLSPSGPVTLTVIERPGDAPHRCDARSASSLVARLEHFQPMVLGVSRRGARQAPGLHARRTPDRRPGCAGHLGLADDAGVPVDGVDRRRPA